MRRTFILIAFLALASSAAAQDFSKVEVKSVKVGGNVYMLTGAGGNIAVLTGDDGVFMIDDQFAPLAPKIAEAIRVLSPKPVRFVLNTHYHMDHTGGNQFFGAQATIIAHDNVRKRLESGAKAFGRDFPPSPKAALPVITFDDRITLHLDGDDVRIIHYPDAHTDGDAIAYFPQSKVLHMGDEFFNGGYPIIDTENGGNVRGLIAAVDKTLPMIPDDVKIIPGHGPLGDKASLRAYGEMLEATSAAVEKELKAGKTAAQMKEANVLAPWNETWGKSFVKADRYIDELVASLQ